MKSHNGIIQHFLKAYFPSNHAGWESKNARQKVRRSFHSFEFGFFVSMNLFIVVVLVVVVVVVLVSAGSIPSGYKL
jgi:uncharacterized membrane protein